jgi:hypothetical protein
MELGKGRRWGAAIFGGEKGEEVRWLHGARGGRHNEERCGGWRLEVKDEKGNWVVGSVDMLYKTYIIMFIKIYLN